MSSSPSVPDRAPEPNESDFYDKLTADIAATMLLSGIPSKYALLAAEKIVGDPKLLEGLADNARRLERVHQAMYLWTLAEGSETPPANDYERGADMAYQNAAAYLLADVSRHVDAGRATGTDLGVWHSHAALWDYPELVAMAQGFTVIIKGQATGEVDRAIEAVRSTREAASDA